MNVVRSQAGLTASQWTVSPALDAGTTYYWRVWAHFFGCDPIASGIWSFTPQAYVLTVVKNPDAGGTVTSSPAGIDCGPTCSASFVAGTTVTLTATPAAGWQLGSWAGCDVVNGAQCTVTMNTDRTVTVNFSCISLGSPSLLNPPNGATGISTTPTLDWSDSQGASSYDVQVCADSACGTVVRSHAGLTASQWTVSPALDAGTTYYWRARATSACAAGAWTGTWSFTTQFPPSYALAVTKNETIGGTVTSSPAGIDCGPTCSASFVAGTTVTLTATPAGEWQFSSWAGCDMTSGNQCTVTVNGPRTVTANFVTCPGKPWSWGSYDWLSCPAMTLTDIANVVTEMANKGFRGFRTFMNAYFDVEGDNSAYETCRVQNAPDLNQRGVQPYSYAGNAFNLCQWDSTYWSRVQQALQSMRDQGYRKILFTIGHKYQGSQYGGGNPRMPWVHNTNNINICSLAGDCGWIHGWNNLKTQSVTSCDFTGTADQWVIHEYKKLIEKLRQVAAQVGADVKDRLVIEIYNEASPTTIQAHCEIIQALKSQFPDLRLQINIDPPWQVWDAMCGNQFLRDMVETWAAHTLRPETLQNAPDPIFLSGKLELSTDGQWCNEGPVNSCCPCCHISAGELLDAAIQRALTAGWTLQTLPFAFEHDAGRIRVSWPPDNGIGWKLWEEDEVWCLFQRHCQGLSCPGPIAGDVKGRLTGPFSDGPLTVSVGSSVGIFWNTTFRNSQNPYTCSVSGVGDGTYGCAGITAMCGTTAVALTCNGIQKDTLILQTCGNGVCDTACENSSDCPQDCPPPREPVAFLWVNGSADPVVNVSGETYTVTWNSEHAASCTLSRNNQVVSDALNGSLEWPIGNVCDSNADCDPGERCITQPNAYYDETWDLTCSNASGQDSKTVTARVHYRFCT